MTPHFVRESTFLLFFSLCYENLLARCGALTAVYVYISVLYKIGWLVANETNPSSSQKRLVPCHDVVQMDDDGNGFAFCHHDMPTMDNVDAQKLTDYIMHSLASGA